MKYVTILFALAVACLLAVPALAAQNGNGHAGDCGQGSGNCGQCPEDCGQGIGVKAQGAQNQNAGCQGTGACDGTGPKRDGSCKA